MHRALEIQEICLSIFENCSDHRPSSERPASDLLALARTCRAFKEPALDVLWATLLDSSPIARCLPEASRLSFLGTQSVEKQYAFIRSPTQIEWDILRSYARRIRSIRRLSRGLDWESVRIFLNPSTAEPLFPNLRHLDCGFVTESMRFLSNMSFPSLISLRVAALERNSLHVLQDTLESFFNFSTSVRRLSIFLEQPDNAFSDFTSSYICRWKNLQFLECGSITLDVDSLAHLSRMPALTRLTFRLRPSFPGHIPPSDLELPLFFSNLHNLSLYSELLDPISLFLTQVRLPAIVDLSASIERRPSKLDMATFLTNIQTSVISRTIQGLSLVQTSSTDEEHAEEASKPVLGLQDLQSCMPFRHLRRIHLDVEWDVYLTTNDLLALASAWPRLEQLLINEDWGWKTLGGITPDGVRRLLETCQSLRSFALAIDTRGCTELPSLASLASLQVGSGWTRTLPSGGCIDVLDSVLEADAVPAMAAFLASIAPRANFSFRAGRGWFMQQMDSTARWYEAYKRVNDILNRGS